MLVKKENKVGGSESVLSAYESSGESGGVNSAGAMMGDVLQNISSIIANVGTALLENMKAEQVMRLMQSLDTRIAKCTQWNSCTSIDGNARQVASY